VTGFPDLAVLTRASSSPLVTRFAPSPTGYLHLGHVVNAIYVWGVARAVGARVLLRVEDHDRIRSRGHFEMALLEDLEWLGFVPDDGLVPVHRQSDRSDRYDDAIDRLRRAGQVYACRCSRRDLSDGRYSGRCRDLGLPEGTDLGLRMRLQSGVERAHDVGEGPIEQDPSRQCGDVLARDRSGHWTYQFAVVVDDLVDDVTLVIRGSDLLDSTGRQVAIGRMLGRLSPPLYLHHPLLLRPDGRKLSKSGGDAGIRELRRQGLSAAAVIGRAAAAVGLLTEPRPVRADDISALFLR
jgi:glutamyl-Q tRNA(Asp) synthetase